MFELLESPGEYAATGLRRCSRCGQLKPIDEFPIKVKATGLRRTWCRDCCRAYGREHYQRCRPAYLDKADRRRKVERPIVRERVFEYLRSHPCVDCGESEIVLLDFDHREPLLKRITVSRLIQAASWPAAEREIAKCDVRCANCHRRRTAQQFGWAKVLGVWIDTADVRPGQAGRYGQIDGARQDALFSVEPHGLRRCSRCHELKPLNAFPFSDIRTGARGWYCRACQAAYRRQHYERHREDYIARAIDEVRMKKEDTLIMLHEYLRAHPCVDCGETDIVALDFDHVDPREKKIEVSKMIGRRPWSSVLLEIEKCEVRCANCHRRKTANDQAWAKRLGEETSRYARIPSSAGVAQG